MSTEKETLFSLVKQANAISQMLAETSGEITPEIEALMGHVDVAIPEKIDSYQFVMESLEKDAAHFKAKADLYSKVAKAHGALQDKIKERLKEAMKAMGVTELKGHDVRFKLSNAQPKLILDEAKLPADFKMVVTTTVADKERIKEALKEGFTIPGATLEASVALRSYVNKKE